jgi:cell division protein FtsB
MDHEVNGSPMNGQRRTDAPPNDVPVGFFEQLTQFFRRNMYWFLIVGFALLLLQDTFGTHGVLAMRRSKKETQEIRKDIKRLDEENLELQNRVKALKTDPTAVEKPAREIMKLARPGEVIFETRPRPIDGSHTTSPNSDNPSKQR